MTTVFILVGVVGFALLVLGLVVGDLFDVDADADGSGVLSVPVIGAFLGAFGIGGLATASVTDSSPGLSLVGATAAGAVLAAVALRLTRALMHMPTDATPGSAQYMGQIGRVVTPIAGGRGEVMLRLGGSPQKLAATSDAQIERGAQVVVIEVLSTSSVRVIPVSELLEEPSP